MDRRNDGGRLPAPGTSLLDTAMDKLGERGKRAAALAARLLGGCLLGRVTFFGRCAPLGPGFTGACGGGAEGACAAVGAMLGAVSRMGLTDGLQFAAADLLIYAAAVLLRSLALRRKPWFMPLVCLVMSACAGAVYLYYGPRGIGPWVLFGTEALLAGGSCVLYGALLRPGEKGDRTGPALLVLGASLALSLWDIRPWGLLSLGRLLAAFAVLAGAYTAGAPRGSLMGLALGLSLDAAAGLPGPCTLAMAGAGAFAGLFRGRGRLAAAVCYVTANAIAAFWAVGPELRSGLLYEGFIASVIFLLPTEEFYVNLMPREQGRGKGAEAALSDLLERTALAASALRDLGRLLEETPEAGKNDEDLMTVFDVAAETVCRRCRRRDVCWGREYEDTRGAMVSAAGKMDRRGEAEPEDLPQWFRDRCLDVRGLTRAVSLELKALYARRQMKSRLRSDREILCRLYGDFSLTLGSLGTGDLPGREERRLERKLDDYLREYAPGTECGVFRDRNRRLRVELRGPGAAVLPLREGWLKRIEGVMGLPLVCPETGGSSLRLYEAEPLEAEVGMASAGKAGRQPSGDYARFFKTPEGCLFLLLADGMGSGGEAAREGAETGELAERLLRAGLEPEAVLRLLNTALMLRCEKRMCPACLDLLQVDLFTGETLVVKYGAAPSYVRVGEELRVVEGRTRPAGLSLEGPDLTRLRLEPGSAAVILSDGAARAEVIRQKLLDSRSGGMKALAGEILTDAAARAGWEDDMTVLTLALEKRREAV